MVLADDPTSAGEGPATRSKKAKTADPPSEGSSTKEAQGIELASKIKGQRLAKRPRDEVVDGTVVSVGEIPPSD